MMPGNLGGNLHAFDCNDARRRACCDSHAERYGTVVCSNLVGGGATARGGAVCGGGAGCFTYVSRAVDARYMGPVSFLIASV
jgi:hypothetical protein